MLNCPTAALEAIRAQAATTSMKMPTQTPTPTLTPTQLLVSRDASADAAKLMRDAVAQRIAGGHGLAGLCPDPKKLC